MTTLFPFILDSFIHNIIHLFHQVTQLTGFSDPVYAEAYVNVNQYDIVLDVLIVNQTRDTLQACTLELATLGDLKLVEKPQVGLWRILVF